MKGVALQCWSQPFNHKNSVNMKKKYEHVKSLGGVHVEVEIVGKTGKIK